MQSKSLDVSMHIAIIMDGNGRWATRQGWARSQGHRQGAKAVRRTVECARRLQVNTLTLYAFSSDNWARPQREVNALMRLLHRYLVAETQQCIAQSIRINVIGRRDRLSSGLMHAITRAEQATSSCDRLNLRIAVDYSARQSIQAAAQALSAHPDCNHAVFSEALGGAMHSANGSPPVDLLIRTGGEKRLSDFLLWECAYAELFFTDRLWPDFGESEFVAALDDYRHRNRRFGRLAAGAI
ncbi:MAG: polyprenyl diphosphate synthase [Pseudomonadota bacterium]